MARQQDRSSADIQARRKTAGAYIRRLRRARNLTQAQLADAPMKDVARRAAERAYAEYALKGYGLLIGWSLEDLIAALAEAIDPVIGRFCEGPEMERGELDGQEIWHLLAKAPSEVGSHVAVERDAHEAGSAGKLGTRRCLASDWSDRGRGRARSKNMPKGPPMPL
jgi:transcriptional regulator with XRE-family HTH domain